MKKPNLTDYLTIKQAAEFLGVSPGTLRNWDRAGKIQTHRHPISGYRLFDKQSLEQLLQQVRDSAKSAARATERKP